MDKHYPYILLHDATPLGFRLLKHGERPAFALDTGGEIGQYLELCDAAMPELITALLHSRIGTDPESAPDNEAVVKLAIAMMAKLDKKRQQGYNGWNNPELCPPDRLPKMLISHLQKGDVVDIANFCAMVYSRPDCRPLADVVREWLDQITPASPDLSQLERLAEELGSAKAQAESLGRAVSEKQREVESLREALKQAEERTKAAALARDVAEQQLTRALGYIDRVNEENGPTYVAAEPVAQIAPQRGPNTADTPAERRQSADRMASTRRW
jgi:hypothetical protein